jgi:hypothetical protein
VVQNLLELQAVFLHNRPKRGICDAKTGITIHGRPDRPARRWRPWNVPSAFWFVGGTNPDTNSKAQETGRFNEIPTNHNPRFLPGIHPTLETRVEALIVAAEAWMSFNG